MSRQFATPLVNNLVKSLHRMRLGPMEAWATSSAVTRLYGGSDGKASILIQHGAGGHGLLFSSVVTRFSPNAYAVSLPHHELDDLCASNETDEKAMLGNISDMAAVLEEALEQLPRPRILLGHSMGGAIAQTVALNNKVALDGLILYSTSSRLRVSAAIFDALRNPTGAVSADDFRYLFGPNVSTDLLDQQMDLRFLHNQQALSDFSACNSFDVMAQVSQIKVPTLIISGEHDNLTPVKFQETMHKSIAGSKLVIIPDVGHMGHLENEDRFCKEVDAFVQSVTSKAHKSKL